MTHNDNVKTMFKNTVPPAIIQLNNQLTQAEAKLTQLFSL